MHIIRFPLIMSIAIAFSGCDTTSSEPVQNGERTQAGAIMGAMVGGFLGGISDDDDKVRNTVIGAAAGAAVGAAIGQALDRQARDLEQSLNNSDVTIVNTGSELIVTMPQDILFDVDSATLRADLEADIVALAENLQSYPDTTVDVIGHTDNTGTAAYNQDLSTRRAASVSAVLLRNGVAGSRIQSYGRGETEPVATNLNADGRRQNRRVEFIIRPMT